MDVETSPQPEPAVAWTSSMTHPSLLRIVSSKNLTGRWCLRCMWAYIWQSMGGRGRWADELRSSPALFENSMPLRTLGSLDLSSLFQIFFGAGHVDQWCFTFKTDAETHSFTGPCEPGEVSQLAVGSRKPLNPQLWGEPIQTRRLVLPAGAVAVMFSLRHPSAYLFFT
jgi:hypothetical protein